MSSPFSDALTLTTAVSSSSQSPTLFKPISDMKFSELWPNNLKHKTDLIQEQLEVGLYSIKRYAFYLTKTVELKRPVVAELKKITDHERNEKSSRAAKDGMSHFIAAYTCTQNIIGSICDLETTYINTIESNVCQLIYNYIKSAEKRLETTTKKLQSVFAKQRELLTKIAKSRSECHKQWSALQSAWKECEKAEQQKLTKKNGVKEYEVCYKKYTGLVTKTYSAFNAFETEVKEANEQQRVYWHEELPQCVRELELLETERLFTWGNAMTIFRNAQHEYFTKSVELIGSLDTVTGLDGNAEIKQWTDSLVRTYQLPVEPDFIHDHLPCEYTRVQHSDELQHLLSIDLSVALAQRQQQQQHFTQRASPTPAQQQSLGPNFTRPAYFHAVGKVLFDYLQTDNDDLGMIQGDYIAVLDMPLPASGEDSTWWIGGKFDPQTGKLLCKGVFPSNYITLDF